MTRPVVIYDGACALCQGGIHWISRRAVRGALEFLPCQSVERRARFPALEEARCMEAIHLVLPDGRVLAGHAAIPEILRHLNGWRRLAALFRLARGAMARPRRLRVDCPPSLPDLLPAGARAWLSSAAWKGGLTILLVM